jgi:hypothetical protein
MTIGHGVWWGHTYTSRHIASFIEIQRELEKRQMKDIVTQWHLRCDHMMQQITSLPKYINSPKAPPTPLPMYQSFEPNNNKQQS